MRGDAHPFALSTVCVFYESHIDFIVAATAENVPAKETSEISASIQEEEGKSNVAAASAPTAAAAVPSDKDTPFDEQDEGKEEAEGEEEETCGFCIFMKGGGCKEAFQV